jgi:hypothetical protein
VATEDDEIAAFLREEVALRTPAAAPKSTTPVKDAYGDTASGKVAQSALPASVTLGQGASLGFSDELGAAIDTGISKLPFGIPRAVEAINSIGGHPGLSPLDKPLTYEQRRDEYRNRNAAFRGESPYASAAGQIAGGVMVSPLMGPGAAASTPVRLAASTAEGAVAGVGLNERPEDILKDTATGAGIGLGAGALGSIIQKKIAGAPARDDARLLNRLGATPKTVGRSKVVGGEIDSNADDVLSMLKSNGAIKAAARAGDPRRVVAANAEAMAPKVAETQKIYQAANAAKGGGLDPVAARKALNAALDKAIKEGAPKAYANRMKAAIDQVEALEVGIPWQTAGGSGVNKVIPADKLRAFITKELAPTEMERKSGVARAVESAALALKAQLYKFAGKDAARLMELDKDVSTHILIEKAALNAFNKGKFGAPPPPAPIKGALQAAGEAADRVVSTTVGKSPNFTARTPAAALESGTRRAAVQGFVDKLSADDRDGANRALVEEIYGAP